ncbi:PP2C family serine/threonine-protein phosphatase [Mycoplasma marinum]|uniref:Serine/threonine-protein phosphatase n=1 Tax=Mycoplasma marinum TaxID=1937190 RepID=A0A4R0XQQ6_9MOLU|nr:protein phosphatase 2C domain-containing protein [Mycoplasma marinum]TCG10690.1 serine/threonine-protein phosphatase [Mycoplasma marinum]
MQSLVKSDIGVVRAENQDKATILEKDGIVLSVLCDGMGGHTGGSYASRLTIEAVEKEFIKHTPHSSDELFPWFKDALKRAKKLMEKAAKNDKPLLDMGTTVTLTLFYPDGNAYIFNVGDSRTYIYNGLLHQITVDHNLRNYYINEEGLSPEKAANILGGAALTSALGPRKTTRIDAFQVSINKETEYIIQTSDGIHDYLTKPQFESIVGSKKPLEEICDELIETAIKGNSGDNLTIAIVKVRG